MAHIGRAIGAAPFLSIALVLLLPSGATPESGLRLSVHTAPRQFEYPGSTELTFRVEMESGTTAERFSLRLSPPEYGKLPLTEGSSITPAHRGRDLSVTGAGSAWLEGAAEALPACSPMLNAFHGYEPEARWYRVELPEASQTTLILRYRTGDHAPWPGLRYEPTITAMSRSRFGEEPGTLDRRTRLDVPRARIRARRSGVRIALRTSPSTAAAHFGRSKPLRAGAPFTISGRTSPPVRGGEIKLRYARFGKFVRLGTAPTDSEGRFRFKTRVPRARGFYELWAFYLPKRRGRLVRDHRCPRSFEVK